MYKHALKAVVDIMFEKYSIKAKEKGFTTSLIFNVFLLDY